MAIPIAFDRIATSYDAQRAHPPEVSAQVGAAIATLTGPGALTLELGVGTGRIALPARAAGCRVVGVDIAREMLQQARRLRDTQAGPLFALLQGDIARLPLRSDTFDAVLAVHVLHLVPDWRGALAEVARVLRPGGVFLQGRDWRDPHSCTELLRGKLREAVMALLPGARPPGAGAALAQAIARLGGTIEPEHVAAEWTSYTSPARVLEGMAARADAETWALDDALLQAAVARVRAWAADTWADLDAEQPVQQRFILTPIRGQWGAAE